MRQERSVLAPVERLNNQETRRTTGIVESPAYRCEVETGKHVALSLCADIPEMKQMNKLFIQEHFRARGVSVDGIEKKFIRKCRRVGKEPADVVRQLIKQYVNSGKRYVNDRYYSIIEDITSSSDVYRLLRSQFGGEWANLDALCNVLRVDGIDRSVLQNALGKGVHSLDDISKLFWSRSNYGVGDLCVFEPDISDFEPEPDSVVLLPSYRFFNIAMRNVRRRIQLCEFFAIKLHRWYSFAARPSDLRQMRQLSLFPGL